MRLHKRRENDRRLSNINQQLFERMANQAFLDHKSVTLRVGSTWVRAIEALYRHCILKVAVNSFIACGICNATASACGKSRLIASAAWFDQLERDAQALPRWRAWLLQSKMTCGTSQATGKHGGLANLLLHFSSKHVLEAQVWGSWHALAPTPENATIQLEMYSGKWFRHDLWSLRTPAQTSEATQVSCEA